MSSTSKSRLTRLSTWAVWRNSNLSDPTLPLSTSTLNLGTVTVGTTSSARSVTVTNRQNVALSFTSIVVSAGFNVASNTCGASIAAGASCSVSVTFSPTVAGATSGTLTITDSAPNSPQTVSLTGTGR